MSAYLDTGAQTSVIGLDQAKEYCRYRGIKLKTNESRKSFRFGSHMHESLGDLLIQLPLSDGYLIPIQMGGVSAEIPMLVGLDCFDRYSLVLENFENVLESVLAARKYNSPENSVTFIWSSSLAAKLCTQKRN
jgi:hypothetical protein